jgi:hypothetical protein
MPADGCGIRFAEKPKGAYKEGGCVQVPASTAVGLAGPNRGHVVVTDNSPYLIQPVHAVTGR